MMKFNTARTSFFQGVLQTLCAAVGLAAAVPAAAQQDVAVRFTAEVGGETFACGGQYSGVGVSGATIIPSDFRLYLTGVALVNAAGELVPLELHQDGMWQYQDIVLLDFEDGTGPCINGNAPTNSLVRGTVPAGDYQGVQFTLGLPFELNHADNLLAVSPLNLSAMFWNWQGGHRFFKVDIDTVAAGGGMGMPMRRMHEAPAEGGHGNAGFLIHLGSTGCASASATAAPVAACANPNSVTVMFNDFDPATGSIAIDLAGLLQDSDPTFNTPDTAPGCMSGIDDPECAGIFSGFGLDGSAQRVFRVK